MFIGLPSGPSPTKCQTTCSARRMDDERLHPRVLLLCPRPENLADEYLFRLALDHHGDLADHETERSMLGLPPSRFISHNSPSE